MKSNIWKSTFREIKQSFGRFMAIFAITALGVSLFSGLKVLQPAMVKTTNSYFQEKEFYNYRVISNLGFEEKDLEFLQSQEEVLYAEGIVSFDMLCSLEQESVHAIKIYNLPEKINNIELLHGRMPESAKECIVDSAMYGTESLGKNIYLSEDNDDDDLEYFQEKEYTIVGIAQTSNYIQNERGNTSIGNGKIAGFVYIPMNALDVEFYTEILIRFDEEHQIYSDAYEEYMDAKDLVWEELAEEASYNRYDRIVSEAIEELEDAKKEFAEEKADAEAELEDARKELADAYIELKDADLELADAKKEVADGRVSLEENREQLRDAEREIGKNSAELDKAEEEIYANIALLDSKAAELAAGKEKIEDAQAKLDEQRKPLDDAAEKMEAAKEQITTLESSVKLLEESMLPEQLEGIYPLVTEQEEALAQIESGVDLLVQSFQEQPEDASKEPDVEEESETQPGTVSGPNLEETVPPNIRITAVKEKLKIVSETISNSETQIAAGLKEAEAAQKEINKNKALLDQGEMEIASGRAKLTNGLSEIENGRIQIEDGKKELNKGWRKFSEGEAELLEGEAELADAEKELADGWNEYYDGLAEYEEGYQEFVTEIADAEAEIADAETEIADIDEPESYLLGRETNVGYACMENDSAVVNGIANVFPVFFYAVAALVCMTTMNRMIEEQRTQIGVLKALGYSEATIMGKYLFYSGAAAVSGCLVGYFFGTWFFPYVIWIAYSSMYDVAAIQYVFDGGVLAFSLAVSIICSMGVTYISCKNELSEVAAELMRPKAPKAGKRIFLEYIPFIWKPMKFLHKVSYRNVFRYKKRFFMMVIGISGCTGLMVTGFGVLDSIANIANDQYGRIQVVDVNVMLSEEVDETTDRMVENVAGDRVAEYVYVMEKSIDLAANEAIKSISLIAIDENEDISPYVKLPDLETGELLNYPGPGECILTGKIAKTYDLSVGDVVVLRDENNHSMELTLSGIAENYLSNFVYMTTQTYEDCLGEPAELKSIYVNLAENVDAHQVTADFMKEDEVASAQVLADSKGRFTDMIDSLDMLVGVITVCAGCLAFIVLYNLTNINITERIREIATIKVLGFYRNETASYVFRENIILTAFGAIAGLGLGKLFHAFVMSQVQVDQVSFAVRILPKSYLYSVILTFVFAILINWFMTRKLDKVSMTESLKSVD